jgi:Zn-dependent peptidase ImmA (M78 family)
VTELEPVSAARYLRTELRIGLDNPIPDLLALVEDSVGLPVTVWPLPDGVAGAYGLKSDRAFIFVNSGQWPVRRRFTLAHELGHHMLHQRGIIDSERDIFGEPTSPREQQANAFAAEFLVPLIAVQNWMEREQPDGSVNLDVVVQLAAFFGVSATVARIRLEKARYIPRTSDRQRLKTLIHDGRHTERHNELGLGAFRDQLAFEEIAQNTTRVPRELWDNAIRSYQLHLASLEELAHTRRMEPAALAAELEQRGIAPLEDEDDGP